MSACVRLAHWLASVHEQLDKNCSSVPLPLATYPVIGCALRRAVREKE
ncbi:MAG: hypothetical protein MJE68_00450 [Proteobacteria bacterium]|nr:hypothetical protein [Pseudomonadota bacterium]